MADGDGPVLLGTQVLAFGMTWAAASVSGAVAGLMLTAVTLPRVLLLLVGGAVADRTGAFRVLLLGDGVMLAVTLGLGLGLALAWTGVSPALMIGAGLAIGLVDAFYLPASATMPRLLAPVPRSHGRWPHGSSPASSPCSVALRWAGCWSRWPAWRPRRSSTRSPSR
jgi:MFS family permease